MEFAGSIVCLLASMIIIGMIFLASAIRIVGEDTRLTVYRLGRNIGDRGPGIVLLIPIIDRGELKKLGGAKKVSDASLVGAAGETLTTVFRDGRVLLPNGEWDAVSQTPIAAGQRVRVVRTILEVEEE